MPEKYRVTQDCYVPIKVGDERKPVFKRAGQVVTLDKRTADKLDGFVESVDAAPAKKKAAKKSETKDEAEATTFSTGETEPPAGADVTYTSETADGG